MEDYSIDISMEKIISIETAETVNFHFSHFKSMETICCHSNHSKQSSYPTEIKNTTLNTASDSMKTDFDQKTCQILNKTTTIIDKIKQHSEKVNPMTTKLEENDKTATNAGTSASAAGHNPQKQTKTPGNQNQKLTEKPKMSINQRIPTLCRISQLSIQHSTQKESKLLT